MNIGVLFDVDGVLADSYVQHRESWRRVARADGQDFTDEAFHATFGRHTREIIEMLWDSPRTAEQVRVLDDAKEATYRESVRNSFPAMPGAVDLIRRVHAGGILIGIGSSGPRENVGLTIEKLGIRPYLTAVITGSDIRQGKPHPEVFLKGAEGLHLPPSQCVVIEDARPGIEAGKAAGMKCIAFQSRGHYRDEYDQADLIVETMAEISVEVIRGLVNT